MRLFHDWTMMRVYLYMLCTTSYISLNVNVDIKIRRWEAVYHPTVTQTSQMEVHSWPSQLTILSLCQQILGKCQQLPRVALGPKPYLLYMASGAMDSTSCVRRRHVPSFGRRSRMPLHINSNPATSTTITAPLYLGPHQAMRPAPR